MQAPRSADAGAGLTPLGVGVRVDYLPSRPPDPQSSPETRFAAGLRCSSCRWSAIEAGWPSAAESPLNTVTAPPSAPRWSRSPSRRKPFTRAIRSLREDASRDHALKMAPPVSGRRHSRIGVLVVDAGRIRGGWPLSVSAGSRAIARRSTSEVEPAKSSDECVCSE